MSNLDRKSNMPDQKKFKEFMSRINSEPNFPETLSKIFDLNFVILQLRKLFTDQVLLERYLQINGNDVENAFRLLKHNLEMRQKAPYLFENRDVNSKEIQTACTTL